MGASAVDEEGCARARTIVRDYLDACEAGDLARAGAHLAPEARLTFPGLPVYRGLGEWFSDFRDRFESLRKCDHDYDGHLRADGTWVLACRGTLAGRTKTGRVFSGIRFLDRFELVGDLIIDQQVWNDTAHHGLFAPDGAAHTATERG